MASGCILVIALCNAVDISVNWFLRRSDGIDYKKKHKKTILFYNIEKRLLNISKLKQAEISNYSVHL